MKLDTQKLTLGRTKMEGKERKEARRKMEE
jgi:hypothetical protein